METVTMTSTSAAETELNYQTDQEHSLICIITNFVCLDLAPGYLKKKVDNVHIVILRTKM